MKLSKKNQLSSELLIIDGLWGSGKSVVTELVSIFDSMECWSIDQAFDHIPRLFGVKAINQDAATSLIQYLFDSLTYRTCISRSINFRFQDQTSVFNHPKKYDYLLRVFEKDGNAALEKISRNKMIIPIATHMSSFDNDLFLRALGGRCKIIICTRHPLFVVEHWSNYIGRCQLDPRDTALKIDFNGEDIPLFAHGWEEEYLKANDIERSIKSISLLVDSYKVNIKKMKKEYGNNSVLEIPFEDAVMRTENVVSLMSTFLNRNINTKLYKRAKKRARLPRNTIVSGLGYASFDWKYGTIKEESDEVIIKERLSLIKKQVRPEYYHNLTLMISDYEQIT
jgi:hypothetical protein